VDEQEALKQSTPKPEVPENAGSKQKAPTPKRWRRPLAHAQARLPEPQPVVKEALAVEERVGPPEEIEAAPSVSEKNDPPRKVPNISFGADDPIHDGDSAVLSPAASYDNAREFARRRCWKAGSLAVYFWRGKFLKWNGRIYETLPEAELKAAVYRFLDESVKIEGNDFQKVRFRPKQSHVHDLLDGLRAGLALPGWCDPPMRLDTGQLAAEIL